jgi:hypothetical protein
MNSRTAKLSILAGCALNLLVIIIQGVATIINPYSINSLHFIGYLVSILLIIGGFGLLFLLEFNIVDALIAGGFLISSVPMVISLLLIWGVRIDFNSNLISILNLFAILSIILWAVKLRKSIPLASMILVGIAIASPILNIILGAITGYSVFYTISTSILSIIYAAAKILVAYMDFNLE